ncbi:hypothetical protein FCM35_KLT08555 [Carex littledalei]|uniref:KIB1-4 beta-propeller domain-containing protein n=1 Tax=Carex littledalei TaxID=544730 RepID=A0A833VHT2_9POAL|nr:hypothetical protein FCM35_KLT08555 [Carex littledalei]
MENNYCSVPKDWAELSPDLLPLIAHKLGDIVDFIRFRAVCKQWRLATNLLDNPPQFPWIMMLKLDETRKISFHALPSGKIFSGPFLKYIHTMCIHRRSYDTIVEKDQKDSSILVNKFPSYLFPLRVKWFRYDVISGRDQLIPYPGAPVGNISKFLYTTLSSKMTRLIVAFSLGKVLAQYRGRIFKLVTTRPEIVVNVSDVYTGKVLSTISCPVEVMVDSCLISTRDGLLMVSKKSVYDKPYLDYKFVVYRLQNYDNNHPNWTILSGIGDMMLFLDDRNAFSLIAGEYDHGYRGNCIYFITRLKTNFSHFNSETHNYKVVGYDMGENRSFEVCSLGEYTTQHTELFWFIPSLV